MIGNIHTFHLFHEFLIIFSLKNNHKSEVFFLEITHGKNGNFRVNKEFLAIFSVYSRMCGGKKEQKKKDRSQQQQTTTSSFKVY